MIMEWNLTTDNGKKVCATCAYFVLTPLYGDGCVLDQDDCGTKHCDQWAAKTE